MPKHRVVHEMHKRNGSMTENFLLVYGGNIMTKQPTFTRPEDVQLVPSGIKMKMMVYKGRVGNPPIVIEFEGTLMVSPDITEEEKGDLILSAEMYGNSTGGIRVHLTGSKIKSSEVKCGLCVNLRSVSEDTHRSCINTDAIVQLNQIGVQRGWANWPHNFDPVWIISCNSFKEKS